MSGRQTGWRNLPPALIAGFALLIAMVAASLLLSVQLAGNVTKTRQITDYGRAVGDVITSIRDAESAQRGYLLTMEERYLDGYRQAQRNLPTYFKTLRDTQGARGRDVAERLEPVIAAKMTELAATIETAERGDRDEALGLIKTGEGRTFMAEIRTVLDGERDQIRQSIVQYSTDSRRTVQQLTVGLIGGLIGVLVLALIWLRQARNQYADVDAARLTAEDTLTALKTENAAREEAEAQLRQFQKMESVGQLTGGIAHDFNNMLAVVSGGIELAQRKLRDDPDKAERYLENAREGATRAAALTSRLLAFSRRQPLAPVPLDANKLLRGMCEMLTRTLGDNITVECVDTAGLWRCYADAGEIENAVLNLAVNARDAMPDGGKLTIDSGNAHIDDDYARTHSEVEPGQYVAICVTDTGTGMPREVIDRAFDPFFTTKSVGKGTGLGLSQVFGFVKQSGGHVAIYSEIGQGTTVKLYLPRFIGVEETRPAGIALSGETPTGNAAEIILVVEDEQRVRHFAVDVLRELGYSTVAAGSPVEALRLLEENPDIAMLFTDIVMPDMNGRRLADLALAERPDLKVLFTTGYTRNAVVHNGMLDIGVAFLPKPYTIAALAVKVREVLDGRGINRAV